MVSYIISMAGSSDFRDPVLTMLTARMAVYNDPEAAELVFNAGWHVTVCPLNVTQSLTLDSQYLQDLQTVSYVGDFVRDLSR